MELTFPIKGKSVGLPSSKQPAGTSRDLNNVRPYWDGKLAGGQRPAMDKKYSQQIASAAIPIVAVCSVTTVSVTS
jgi:hypothetical protein